MQDVFLKYGIPCGFDSIRSPEDIDNIMSLKFDKIGPVLNCFSDCISKKIGILDSSSAFQMDVWKERLSSLILEERLDEFMDACRDKIGTENCQVSRYYYECILDIMMDNIF